MSKKRKKSAYVMFGEEDPYNVAGVYHKKKTFLAVIEKKKNDIQEHINENRPHVKLTQNDNSLVGQRYDVGVTCPAYSWHVAKCEIEAPDDIDVSSIQKVWMLAYNIDPLMFRLFYRKRDAKALMKMIIEDDEMEQPCLECHPIL